MTTTLTHPAALRPGVALGSYPENLPARSGAIERVAERVAGRLRTRFGRLGPASLARFSAAVERAEAALDDDLMSQAQGMRRALLSDGLSDELVARSFALARRAAEATLGQRHYPCQLEAGRAMLDGALVEMATGEGKTLAATLPAATAALAGIPVHVVTANDYLVTRDAAAMAPLFRALGLRVGAITESSTPDMRREAYARDITYVTSKQLAFDYLRDRLARGDRHGATRARIDALRGVGQGGPALLMRGLCFAIVDEADSVLIDEARTPFIIAGERDAGDLGARCAAALVLAGRLDPGLDFVCDAVHRRAQLTERGAERVLAADAALPAHRRQRLAIVEQALGARHMMLRDRDYLVRDGKVQIIDPLSGRVMADRSWSRGLQQMIETKEGCALTAPRDTLARLTFQRFFRRYLRLGGMTGTAREVAGELWSTYRLPVVAIETHRPCRRVRLPTHVCASAQARWSAIAARAAEVAASGRPVLIGTRSVADSETLSQCLRAAGIAHQVLNARQDAQEARIVAGAGAAGCVTVATNMAGRGTDIALGDGVARRGGLHVITAERNDAGRLDRQLAGRCARQGEPGSVEVFVSPDDRLIRDFVPDALRRRLRALAATRLGQLMLIRASKMAQSQCERRHRNDRRDLAIMAERHDKLLSFAGQPE